jgi:hypothetical protein
LIKISLKNQVALVTSVLIGVFYQYLSVLEINSSLALTSMDDGPVIPYLLTKRFDLFFEDYWSLSWWQLRWTSSSKWIPALLGYLNIDINGQLLQIIFLAFQGMFLTLGVYVLSYSIIKNRILSLLIVVFFCVTRPHFNNWAFYGDQEFMPYVTWLALGPLMLGLGLKILNKNRLAVFFIALGSSLHVSMGIVFGIAIFAYSCFQNYKIDKKIEVMNNAKILLGPIIFFVMGYLSLITVNINYENIDDIKSLLVNQHYRAWIINPNEKSYLLTTQSLLMAFLLIGIIYTFVNLYDAKHIYSYNIYFKFIIFINILFYLFQAIFYTLGITKLASVSWGRVSLVLIISLFIIILDLVNREIIVKENYSFQDRIILLLTLGIFLLGSKISMIIFLVILILFLFKKNVDKSKEFKRNYFVSNGITVSLGLLGTLIYLISLIDLRIVEIYKQVLNVVFNFNGSRTIIYLMYELLVDSQQSYVTLGILSIDIFISAVLFILIFFIFIGRKNIKLLSMIIIFGVSLLGIQNKYAETQNRNNRYETYKDVQLWAKWNSSKEETFVVEQGASTYGAWGTLSERPRLITSLQEGQQYLYTKRNKQRNIERLRILNEIQNKNINKYSDEYYRVFKKYWNFNYVVQRNDSLTLLDSNKIYVNQEFTVFKIE